MIQPELTTSLKVCPQCGSAGIDDSVLHDGRAVCRGCLWQGKSTELLSVPVGSDSEEWIISILNDLRKILSGELGVPYLKFLLKWGFVQGDPKNIAGTLDRKIFARYLASIGASIIRGLLETRAALETERVREENAKEPS